MPLHKDILAYNAAQSAGDRRICDALARAIDRHLPRADAENKIWHRHPVWFLDGNPIVGYHKLKGPPPCIRLLFWSGLCFTGLMLDNVLLYADMFVFPDVSLVIWRKIPGLVAIMLLVYGLVWDSK